MIKKTIFKILLVSMLLIAIVFALSAKIFIKGEISYDKTIVQNKLEEELKTWIVDNYSQYYKDIAVSLTPKSITIKNSVANAVFDAKIDLTLKASRVEDLPFMRGMLNYYNSKQAAASKAQIEAANKLLNDWELELKDYIGKPEPTAYATYKIVAIIGDNSTVEEDSVKLYIEEPSSTGKVDEFYPVNSSVFKTSQDMENSGAELMKETLEKVGSSPPVVSTNGIQYSTFLYTYNCLTARDYANQWTSNASYNGNCYENPSKWNTSQYPRYSGDDCNDCADYVSQSAPCWWYTDRSRAMGTP